MSAWISSIHSTIPAVGPGDSPVGPRNISRAMTMPPISPSAGGGDAAAAAAATVTMRNKDGKEKDREKRFSFFGKKK